MALGLVSASLGVIAKAQIAAPTNVGSTSAIQTVTLTFNHAGTINSTAGIGIQVVTQGFSGMDFNYATGGTCVTGNGYLVNQTCTVNYTFSPKAPGQRMGAVEIFTAANTAPIATGYIAGTGNGPLVGFTPGTITTVIGNGTSGYSGDNGPATSAQIATTTVAAVDVVGNIYFVDRGNSRVRKVNAATGIITTVAGNGTISPYADNVPATAAPLYIANGVALDGAGNLYIAEQFGNRIRMVSAATGIITTVAGNGTTGSTGDNGAATSANLNFPATVSVDNFGNLYIADQNNYRIRKVTAATGIISTVAGNGTNGYGGDGGLATSAKLTTTYGAVVDSSGNLYIADSSNYRVRMVAAATGIITTVAGIGSNGFSGDGSAATSAKLAGPTGVALDAAGNLYIADPYNYRIRVVSAATGIINTVAGTGTPGYSGDNGPATAAMLAQPFDVAVDGGGNVYVVELNNYRIRKITVPAGAIVFPTATRSGTADTTDGAGTLTVNNNGTTALNLTVPGTGTNPSITAGFSVGGGGTCAQLTSASSSPGTVVSGSSCNYLVNFLPLVPGNINGSLTIADNTVATTGLYSGNSIAPAQTVLLSGTATASTGVTAQSISFTQPNTPLPIGATPSLTATASSGLGVVFSVDASSTATGSVVGNTVTITSPGNLVIDANQGGNGTYAAAPQVQRTIVATLTSSYSAPSTPVGSTGGTQIAYVIITTAGTLGQNNVLTQGAANKDYAFVGGGTCTTGTAYTVGQYCTVKYTFTPSRPGQRLGAVNLTTGSSSSATVLGTSFIAGIGTGPLAVFPGSTSIATVGSAFAQPEGVAVDGSGDVFVADMGNGAVKKIAAANGLVSSSSTVSTVGSGFTSPSGLAVDGSGNVFVADVGNSTVKEIVAVNGAVLSSSTMKTIGSGFLNPTGLAVDGSGNVFVADGGNGAVKEIVAVNGLVSSSSTVNIVGSGFSKPSGLAVDGSGNVFVADSTLGAVKEIVAVNGLVSSGSTVNTVGSGFTRPIGVSFAASGDLFVTDSIQNVVKDIVAVNGLASSTSAVNTVGNGLSGPKGLSMDGSGNLFVSNGLNNAVKQITFTASPPVSFVATTVGSTSSDSPQTTTLQNEGNSALTLSSVAVSIADYSFSNTSTCSSSSPLAMSAVCTAVVSFTPQAGGVRTANLVLTDDSLNISGSTQNVSLSGTGLGGSTVQTITFPQPASPALLGGGPISLTATSSSGLTVAYSIDASSTATGSISGSTLTPTSGGNLVINANQIGNGTYAGAAQVQRTIVVKLSQTIVFSQPATPAQVSLTPVLLTATSTSGLAVIYTIDPSSTATGSVSGSTVSFTTPGNLVLDANQPGNATYAPAAQVQRTVLVSAANFYSAPLTAVGSTSAPQAAFVAITTSGTLGTISVVTQGIVGADYAFVSGGTCATGTAYTVGQICSVLFSFTPAGPGVRMGAVVLTSSTPTVLGTTYITGKGLGPLATFAPGTITTVAGSGPDNGPGGYGGDGGPATSASLNYPRDVVVDPAGNIYINDNANSRIRKVSAATGNISTIAGNGSCAINYSFGTLLYCVSGDGGPAINAEIGQPSGLAIDGAGNLYFAGSDVVRKVTAATGIITTVVGGGASPGSCAGSTDAVGDGCLATSATLLFPSSVAVDAAGNLYVADGGDEYIRKVDASTGIITVVAGNGYTFNSVIGGFSGDNGPATSARLNFPEAVAVDGTGNIYIADLSNERIRKVDSTTGIITTIAGSGTQGYNGDNIPATSAQLNGPQGLALDAAGNIFIADFYNLLVRRVSAATGLITTVAGGGNCYSCGDNGPATSAGLENPGGVFLDAVGNLYIAQFVSNRVRRLTAAASAVNFATATQVGNTDTTDGPYALTLNNAGNAALSFPAPGTGKNPSISNGFTIGGSSTCPQLTTSSASAGSLASGASCIDVISFAPVVSGNIGGSLVTTDNSLNVSPATQSVSLSGVARGGSTVQTINFPQPVTPVALGVSPVTLTATASSGLAVVYTIDASSTATGSISGSTLTITGTGAFLIDANQPGNGTYAAAAQVQRVIVVNAVPVVSSISPSSGGLTAGTSVTITGANLAGATSVTIGGAAATNVVIVNATRITANAPAGTAGTASVLVTTPAGTNAANTLYTYVAAPTVTGISPSSGPLSAGTNVTVTGTNLTGATSMAIGGTAATNVVVVNATTITATAPAGTAGTASVDVTTAGGTNVPNTLYNYVAAPTVTAISPASGPQAAGTSVTITGTNLSGATAVTIGGAAATGVVVVNSTTITAVAPAGTAGTASVAVTTAGGTTVANTLYTYVAAPAVTGISPASGPAAGFGSVTITGTNLTGTTAVTIGGAAAPIWTVVNATTITATTPPGTVGTASVVVTTPGGSNAANTLYTYVVAPTVTSISPSSGPVAGGTTVTINGTNFTGATKVTIGGVIATNLVVVNATTVTVVLPPDPFPAVPVVGASVYVTTAGGTSTQTISYQYVAAPTVTGISPQIGSTSGGTSVTITGTNLGGSNSSATVTIGGAAATNVVVVSSTTISATTPAGALGTASVVVTTDGGSNAGNTLYSYLVLTPTVTTINPSTGAPAGGNSVTITGTGLSGATVVKFGTASVTTFTANTATSITLNAPAGAAGNQVDITVTNASGTSVTSSADKYTYVAPTATLAVASTVLTQNKAATSFTPVTGSGGTGTLSYGVLPSLPAGLTLSTTTGAITGTPTATIPATTYTVTVTDANGATSTNTFSLTVNAAVTATQTVASRTLTQNQVVTSFTPVTGGGGTTPLAYSVLPALPAGLALSTTTGAITGTATSASSANTYTVTVIDANSASATNTFSLTVNAAPAATQAFASAVLTQNKAVTSFTPVTGSGGTTPLAYSVLPALPTGLTLSTSTGAITGTPTAVSLATTYTVTVTDANSATASNSFSLTVNVAVAATVSVPSTTLLLNAVASSFIPVTGSGGTGTLSYSVLPALPTGLSFSISTGAVSGTPTAVSLAITYTVTVTDANSATAANTFSLQVGQAAQAITAFAPTSPVTYGATPIALTATGGASGNVVTFSILSGPGTLSGPNNATLTVTGAGTIVVAANQTGNSSYTAAPQVMASILVSKASLTVTANGITITYGQTVPSYTATVTGFLNGDNISVVSGTAALSTSPVTPSNAGVYAITPAVGTLAASNYSFNTFTPASLTINQAGVTVTLVSNHPAGNAATTFIYTATVTSATSGVPTGTVSLTATPTSGGPFAYGPLALIAGAASGGGKMTGAANGPVTVTASYSGDANFFANLGSTLVTLGTANYTLSASPSSLTVTRGTPASTTITMTPMSGYVGTATFSCGSLPAFASCIFTPTSVTTTDGVTPQTAVMTIYTLAPLAHTTTSASIFWIPSASLALMILIGRRRLRGKLHPLLLLAAVATLALGASGCGSTPSFVTPTGATNIVVNVSAVGSPGTGSNNFNQTLTLNLTVQ